MKFAFTVERGDNINRVRACTDTGIVVREHQIGRSAILSSDEIVFDWPPAHPDELTAAHLQAALELKPEVLLLGTGRNQVFPDPKILAPAYEAGIGVEIMTTAAACRTYNILIEDGRKVVAALIIGS